MSNALAKERTERENRVTALENQKPADPRIVALENAPLYTKFAPGEGVPENPGE